MPLTNKYWIWVALTAILTVLVFCNYGMVMGLQFIGCYITEQALSLDNLLMFYIIFKFFGVNQHEQKRLLTIGIWSAAALRFVMIFAGAFLLNNFHWLSYVFASFLVYSGLKIMLFEDGDAKEPVKLNNFLRDYAPWLSLSAIIIAIIEITDVIFAVDSIPASFGITTNPYIVYPANLLAILGLRSLYFIMVKAIEKYTYLDKIVAFILIGTGIKFFIWG